MESKMKELKMERRNNKIKELKKMAIQTIVFAMGFSAIMTLTVGCASAPKERTKWTDKGMRVMIDPDSVSEEDYVQIQKSLVQSGKFTVVDRARGMNALKKEQERTQRTEEDRYADKEKWSHWGKMYGVGSIIVGHSQCHRENSLLNRQKIYLKCKQFLSMVDSNTGEVFVAVEGENEGLATYDLSYMSPDWNDVTDKMVESYPKEYHSKGYSEEVLVYQDISKEHAQRQREIASKKEEQKEEENDDSK